MPLLVDTSTVPGPERFDYWAGAHGRVLHPLRLERPGREPFAGRIRAHRVGPVTVFGIEGDASAIERTSRPVADRFEDGSLDANAARLGDCVADMVRMVFTADGAPPRAVAEPADALFAQVKAHIEVHLADTALGPRALAAAHFVSPRLLHRTLAERGHTVAGWIRARRLDAVCRDLADPVLGQRSIRAIAVARGFTDAPHFNRLFRHVHGCTPGEYRSEGRRS